MKEIEKIKRKLERSEAKDKARLLKLCQEYLEEQEAALLPSIQCYAEKLFDEQQDLLLIEIMEECGK